MQTFNIKVYTPVRSVKFSDVESCLVKTDFGATQFLHKHADFVASFTASYVVLKQKGSTKTFKAYRGITCFYNTNNELEILCSGFEENFTKSIDATQEKINEVIKSKNSTQFSLKYLTDEKIALETLEKL